MALVTTSGRAPKLEPALIGLLREAQLALSSLLRQPRYSVPAALSLALGVGASLAVFAVFSALMLRPLPFPEEERLVRVGFPGASEFSSPEELTLSHPLVAAMREHKTVFESLTALRTLAARVQLPGEPPGWAPTQKVELDFFDTLGVGAIRGQVFSARDPSSRAGVVMSHGYLLGMLGAWFTRHLMAAFLQDIAPTDLVTYLAVSAGALLITLGAARVATRPIAQLSPAQVLARH
jgi:hypothetical protein